MRYFSIIVRMIFDYPFYQSVVRNIYANYIRQKLLTRLHQKFPGNIIADDIHIPFPENVSIGNHCIISKGCSFDCGFPPYQGNIELGNQVILGYHVCVFAGGGKIVIHNNVDIGINAVLSTQTRSLTQNPVQHSASFEHTFGEIQIGEGTLIASNATILAGTSLGKFCNVTAGSVVQGVYPDYTTLAGNPARPLPRVTFNTNMK